MNDTASNRLAQQEMDRQKAAAKSVAAEEKLNRHYAKCRVQAAKEQARAVKKQADWNAGQPERARIAAAVALHRADPIYQKWERRLSWLLRWF